MAEPVYLAVGILRRPHGVRGEMVMEMLTDFPERLRAGRKIYLGETHTPILVRTRRNHSEGCLVALADFEGRDEVEKLRNTFVYVRADEIPDLPEGEYYHHQILGMQVVTESDVVLGKVVDILETGVNDVYVVRPERGPEILIPVIDEVILSVDLKTETIRVRLLPGLVDEQK